MSALGWRRHSVLKLVRLQPASIRHHYVDWQVCSVKLTRSMSRKGCSPDNAACEGLFGRLKTELFYPRNWQDITIDQFIKIVDTYIRWYNEMRIKISFGSLSPIEYRASLGITAETDQVLRRTPVDRCRGMLNLQTMESGRKMRPAHDH